MLIPKSYLTTPMPKTIPTTAIIYDDVMIDHNEQLKTSVFSDGELVHINRTKQAMKDLLPLWVQDDLWMVVAGGCWASKLQGEPIKDIDVFILSDPNYPAIEKQKHNAIRDKMMRSFPDMENKTDSYNRNNDKVTEVWTGLDKGIQFIFTKHLTRQALIEDFDYVHCKTSYQSGKLYLTRKIYDAIISKKLIPNNTKNIMQWREEKFLSRGYTKVYETAQKAPLWSLAALSPSGDSRVDVVSNDIPKSVFAGGFTNYMNKVTTMAKQDDDWMPW